MHTPVIALALLLVALIAPAAAQVCPPCDNDIDILIQVPLEGRNYAGPTKFEGDIFRAFGKSYTVEIVFDGVLKPVVSLTILNPGPKQFVRWTTAALSLPNGPHTMTLTIVDLAQPTCPDVRVVTFTVFGAR